MSFHPTGSMIIFIVH